MNTYKKINYIFSKSQKKKLFLLFFAILLGTFLELLGVSAILPFMNIIMSQESIENMKYWGDLYRFLGMESPNQFIMLFAIALIAIYIVKNIYIALMYDWQYRFTYDNQKELSTRMLRAYMQQPYLFHLSHNSAELMRNVGLDVEMFFRAVKAVLQLLTEMCVCLVLVIYLMYVDKSITIGVATFLSVFIVIFFKGFKKMLTSTAEECRHYTEGTTKWLQQSFGGMKEIKVLGRESFFLNQYDYDYHGYAETQRKYLFLQVVPRPIMEAMCVSGLLLVVAIKLYMGVKGTYFISALSVFAIAAFRMLPSFTRITNNMSVLMFNKVAVDAVYHDLQEVEKLTKESSVKQKNLDDLKLNNSIEIKDVYFCYPNIEKEVLNHIYLSIPKNRSVALIGPSGAGKTTLADIILGVLEPQQGNVLVDDIDVYKNLDAWHRNLGYISQTIYLTDDTIRNNIAFGIPENEIDESRIIGALKEAQLDVFVDGLPDGMYTLIGERGVRLSGGQRQRIGIARALYTNPDVLVLDEATSALDNDTESAVMEAIDNLSGNKTLIIIAHRLTTIKNCQMVYEVKDGQVVRIK